MTEREKLVTQNEENDCVRHVTSVPLWGEWKVRTHTAKFIERVRRSATHYSTWFVCQLCFINIIDETKENKLLNVVNYFEIDYLSNMPSPVKVNHTIMIKQFGVMVPAAVRDTEIEKIQLQVHVIINFFAKKHLWFRISTFSVHWCLEL